MNTHTCIMPGCSNTYQNEEPEAYYCEGCIKHKQNVAAEVDKKHANRDRSTKSNIQVFEENAKCVEGPGGRKLFLMRG